MRICSGFIVVYTIVLVSLGGAYYEKSAELDAHIIRAKSEAARANLNAFNMVKAVTDSYEKRLAARDKLAKSVNREYNKAMNQITTAKTTDETFNSWAKQPLPPKLIKRLQQLSSNHEDKSGKGVSNKIPPTDGVP